MSAPFLVQAWSHLFPDGPSVTPDFIALQSSAFATAMRLYCLLLLRQTLDLLAVLGELCFLICVTELANRPVTNSTNPCLSSPSSPPNHSPASNLIPHRVHRDLPQCRKLLVRKLLLHMGRLYSLVRSSCLTSSSSSSVPLRLWKNCWSYGVANSAALHSLFDGPISASAICIATVHFTYSESTNLPAIFCFSFASLSFSCCRT